MSILLKETLLPVFRRLCTHTEMISPVKMFLSSRQAGYSNRQQGPENLEICRVLESDKCEVSGRYFVIGGQIAGCQHILTGLNDHL